MQITIGLDLTDIHDILNKKTHLKDYKNAKTDPRLKYFEVDDDEEDRPANESIEINTAASLLYGAFKKVMPVIKNNKIHNCFKSIFSNIKNLDKRHPRGSRRVHTGLATEEGKAMLKNFSFQPKLKLDNLISRRFSFDPLNGILSWLNFIPSEHLKNPGTAHLASLTLYCVNADFENRVTDMTVSESFIVKTNSNDPIDIVIKVPKSEFAEGVNIYMLQVIFCKHVNKELYDMVTGRTWTIVEVC